MRLIIRLATSVLRRRSHNFSKTGPYGDAEAPVSGVEVHFMALRLQVLATAFLQGSASAAVSLWSKCSVGNLVLGMLRSVESAMLGDSQLV